MRMTLWGAFCGLLLTASAARTTPLPFTINDFMSSSYALVGDGGSEGTSAALEILSYPAAKRNRIDAILAVGIDNRSYEDIGWDFLQMSGSPSLLSSPNASTVERGYYYVGYLEGYLTFDRIVNATIATGNSLTPMARLWIEQHVDYMTTEVERHRGVSASSTYRDTFDRVAFWNQVEQNTGPRRACAPCRFRRSFWRERG